MKGLTPVVLLGIGIAIVYFYIVPQYDAIQVLLAEEATYDEALQAADELKEKKNELDTQYNNFSETDWARLGKFLPDNPKDIRLIMDMNRIAEENGFVLEDISVEEQARGRGNQRIAPGAEAQEMVRGTNRSVQTLGVSFGVEGTYSEFLDFMRDIESSLRIKDVTDISFTSFETEGNEYQFFVRLETYWVE